MRSESPSFLFTQIKKKKKTLVFIYRLYVSGQAMLSMWDLSSPTFAPSIGSTES